MISTIMIVIDVYDNFEFSLLKNVNNNFEFFY
jgi:hypothetical protein